MCEIEIIDCIQINKKHVYKERNETTYEKVGERKTYINNIYEKISTMYVYRWSQDLMYKNNVSKKERKENIHNILTTSLKKKNNNTPPNKMIPKTNSPLKSDYSHIQKYSPFLSRVTKGRVSSRHLIGRASISIII